MLGTTTYIGGVFGALVFGVFSDLRGRRVALLSDISFFLVSSFLSAFVTSPGQLLALRFLVGFGIGADIVSGPALLSEESPTPRRGGLLLGVSLIMMPLGGLVSALLAHVFLTMGLPPGILWRIILGAGAIPAAIVILLRSRLPESTRWLLRGGARGGVGGCHSMRCGGGVTGECLFIHQLPGLAPARHPSSQYSRQCSSPSGGWWLWQYARHGITALGLRDAGRLARLTNA